MKSMMLFHSAARRAKAFWRREEGLAYVEFVFVLPILILLFLGSVEVCRLILIVQKLENTVSMTTDVVAQYNSNLDGPLGNPQVMPMYGAVQDMMNPYSFGANGIVILTDVIAQAGNGVIVQWQSCGGGTLAATSAIGQPGHYASLASLPGGGFAMANGQELLIGEIFYNYSPVTAQNIVSPTQLYRTAVYAPRNGTLVPPWPNPAPTCPG